MGQSHDDDVKITDRDRIMRGWENSMELIRDFKAYSKETEDNEILKNIFDEFAEDEGVHAAKFRELLIKSDSEYQYEKKL